ncbi:glycosyltransferase family 2 protein [Bifidobacterium avesanii]|uniref:Glycosyltransferase family 2 protein n=1 Tax=Bifidobacterium avesanii TaxID=1798157 RepID=A0A7K3TJJ3_9BIFI|nr:glycosyltransferase family 2 protein [Bifidobacterium avesanii]KAB8287937.1 Glycosyl transferase family 2 [Bifidobacterium avesanii]NEG79202.1 hypothetical protein [Bifidobacterium avesanii]
MIQNMICSLPLSFKIAIAQTRTILNPQKRQAIALVDKLSSKYFPRINDQGYKKELKSFLSESFYSAEEVKDYVKSLYDDEVYIDHQGKYDDKLPTIICVVKNEEQKLNNFFAHYEQIGKFNYVFIDNLSTDMTYQILLNNNATVYKSEQKFTTNRKLAWINKVYSTLSNGSWVLLLDADELLTYCGFESIKFNNIINSFEKNNIRIASALMIDMFSNEKSESKDYLKNYRYFENKFHVEKSYYFNSIYGGIREREFSFGKGRCFLIKKHPVVKKDNKTMLIHCHYIYPFNRNFEAKTYFGLLHYKLFDKEIKKYQKIAESGSYGNNSVEYKQYLSIFKNKKYEDIFQVDADTVLFKGTQSLTKIDCLEDVRNLEK